MKYGTHSNPDLSRAESGMYDFKFGQYISDAFNIVTSNLGPIIGFAAIWAVIYFVAQVIPFIGPLAYSVILGPCLAAGLYYVADKASHNEHFEFGLFFKGFDKVGDLALVTILQSLIIIAVLIPAIVAGGYGFYMMETSGGDDGLVALIIGGVLMLPIFYLVIIWVYAPLFVIFYDMQPWKAMEASRKVVNGNWLTFLALFFVCGLIAISGALALGVGLLLTIPAAMLVVYTSFKDIIGMPREDTMMDTMSHLVD